MFALREPALVTQRIYPRQILDKTIGTVVFFRVVLSPKPKSESSPDQGSAACAMMKDRLVPGDFNRVRFPLDQFSKRNLVLQPLAETLESEVVLLSAPLNA